MERINGTKPIDYKTACEQDHLYPDLTQEQQVEFRAIDRAIAALKRDHKLLENFKGRGIEDNIYEKVHTLGDLLVSVCIHIPPEMADEGHIEKWGSNILSFADMGFGTNGNAEVNRRLRDFVLSEDHFGIKEKDFSVDNKGLSFQDLPELEIVR